ncbi:MAG: glycosyltransferase, partial [Prosthecobacter sp.]|nr:glycosyltransferase [Prosthecobacter sp.]
LICCFQNPIHQTEVDWLLSRRREHLALVGISEFQVNGFLPPGIFSVIHNATDMERFNFHPHPAQPPYLVFLGRLTANKGVDTAIAVAKKAGMRLKLAGTVSDEPGGKEFFEQIVRPQLGGNIEYIGPVDDVQKNDLLGDAIGCLFPIRWPEPFGIVMAESLACGTPVVATPCASTPEVIAQGITGFLGETEEALAEGVRNLNRLNREHCRLAAEERFSGEVMTIRYLRIIEELVR